MFQKATEVIWVMEASIYPLNLSIKVRYSKIKHFELDII